MSTIPKTIGRVKFVGLECNVNLTYYSNNRPALFLTETFTNEPVITASVNLDHHISMLPNEVAIKNYSEGEGLLSALVDSKLVTDTGRLIRSGFVDIPVCRLNIE